MANKSSTGTCFFCNEKLGKRAIKTHLEKCKVKHELNSENSSKNQAEKTFLILIESRSRDFWIYLEASEKIALSKIDELLRDVWLECCGHLSSFRIGGRVGNEVPMSKKLNTFMKEGLELDYLYDFGSTTHLKVKVVSESNASLGKDKIRIDAMNDLPNAKCSFCENQAEFICPFCYEEEMCENCIGKHSCAQTEGEDMMMPIVNSPRAGVCGYCGPGEDVVESYYPQK